MIESELLTCGIRLVTEEMPQVNSACLGFWVGTGSRDERQHEEGISHFLEHLLFKGTPRRSAQQIAEQIDAVGGDMNAYTTKEYTTFYVRLLGEDLGLGLDILCDIMSDPALRSDEVDAERQVILEEVLMHLDEPADVVQERFAEAAFPGHPLGREVLGLPEVIREVGVDDIRRFFAHHYRPGNVVVAAAGDIEHRRLAEVLEEAFAGREAGVSPPRLAPSPEIRTLDITERDTEQTQLVLGVRGPDRRSPDRYAMLLLNHCLGGGLSSRLFQKVREERGLCYSIVSDRVAFSDAGYVSVSVGTSPDNAREVLDLVHHELDDLAEHGITERELTLAKGHVRADTLLSLEDSGARMSRIGASLLLHGEVLSPEEALSKINAVTHEEVADLCQRLFSSERILAFVGRSASEGAELAAVGAKRA